MSFFTDTSRRRALVIASIGIFLASCGGNSKSQAGPSSGGTVAAKGGSSGASNSGGPSEGGTGQAGEASTGGEPAGANGGTGPAGSANAGGNSPAGGAGTSGAGTGGMAAVSGLGPSGTGGGAGSGSAGTSGTGSSVGGEGPAPGFACFTADVCETGERCVVCHRDVDYDSMCVPDPDADPAGYATSTADCDDILRYVTCDGPEDCPEGRYCAWTEHSQGAHCVTSDELPTVPVGLCCFTCSSLPICTLCWNDADCPAEQECVAQEAAPRGIGGCVPRP